MDAPTPCCNNSRGWVRRGNKLSSWWPSGPGRGSAAARLLKLRVRIQPGAWMSVSCECCVSYGRGFCYGSITRPQQYYRMWCVLVCDLKTSKIRQLWSALSCCASEDEKETKKKTTNGPLNRFAHALFLLSQYFAPLREDCIPHEVQQLCIGIVNPWFTASLWPLPSWQWN